MSLVGGGKALKKFMEEAKTRGYEEIDLQDKGLTNITDVPLLFSLTNLTSLILSHNRITSIPSSISELSNLESLNLFNNEIEELPTTLCNLSKLRFLNCGLNQLKELPKGFGACPNLEILDLTYNNLVDTSFPRNFYYLTPLRALYLGDNEFEVIAPEIKNLVNLQVLVIRDNDIHTLPKELGELSKLKELHIQNNLLQVLPPELANLDLISQKHILRAENNPWIEQIGNQLVLGTSHIWDYMKTEEYKRVYEVHVATHRIPPPKREREKTLKRKKLEEKKK